MLFICCVTLLSVLFLYYHYQKHYRSSSSSPIQKIKNTPSETVLLFWTGGFDSTFRLCTLLMEQKKIVQPIYISSTIDNLADSTVRRRNQKQELQSMTKITTLLTSLFPDTRSLLRPLIVIDTPVVYDSEISTAMWTLFKRGDLRRPVCQYGALAQISLLSDRTIEIAVEKDEHHSAMYRTIASFLNGDLQLDSTKIKQLPALSIFRKLCFSTITLTKSEMVERSKRGGYAEILKQTWSCWYPVSDRPCGRCIMCKDRVVV